MQRRELIGVLAAAASSTLGGTAVVATRFVVSEVEPVSLALLRYGLGAMLLLPLVLGGSLRRFAGRDLVHLALLGILFFALFPYLFNAALAWTTAARGALALSTLPLLTLAVATLLGAEQPSLRKVAGVLLAIAGIGAALWGKVGGEPEGAWRGDLLMVGTALCGAVYNVLSRPLLRRLPVLDCTAVAMAAGSLALAVATIPAGGPTLPSTPAGWFAVLYLGSIGAALIFWLWSVGLDRTTPTRVAVTVTINPLVAMSLAAALLAEPASPALLLGLLAVPGGIVLANTRSRRERVPASGSS